MKITENLKDIKISEKIDEIFLELCKQVTDKELRRLISDFAALHRMLGAHHANPERYSKFLDDMYVPKETNMYDRCYCSSNCKNDSCGRKNSSNEPFCTTSDFSNFCKSYKK